MRLTVRGCMQEPRTTLLGCAPRAGPGNSIALPSQSCMCSVRLQYHLNVSAARRRSPALQSAKRGGDRREQAYSLPLPICVCAVRYRGYVYVRQGRGTRLWRWQFEDGQGCRMGDLIIHTIQAAQAGLQRTAYNKQAREHHRGQKQTEQSRTSHRGHESSRAPCP